MMKKTFLIINQYGSTPEHGYAGRHYYLGKELAAQGYNVFLVISGTHHLLRSKPNFNSDYCIEDHEGLNVVWLRMPEYSEAHSKIRALGWFVFAYKITQLMSRLSIVPSSVVYSSPSLIPYLGARYVAKKAHARLIFEVRDIWPLTLSEIGGISLKHPFIKLMQWIEDKAYRESDAVVSNLKNAVDHMVERGMDRSKFSWIPNGFSLNEVNQKVPLNQEALDKLPSNKFIVGYTGTLGVANAIDTFIEAAEQLKANVGISFVLVGTGKEKPVLQQMVSDKKLQNVIFIDPIPKVEIQAMLNYFDVCYIGLTKDPLFRFGVSPNKLFDYLYSGKPIIYGIESGEYRPVEDAGAGVQVPAQDSTALSEAVLKLKSLTNNERTSMGKRGRLEALERYEYSKLAESYSKILAEDN